MGSKEQFSGMEQLREQQIWSKEWCERTVADILVGAMSYILVIGKTRGVLGIIFIPKVWRLQGW